MNRSLNTTIIFRFAVMAIGSLLITGRVDAASVNQRDYWGGRYQSLPHTDFKRPSARFAIDAVRRWSGIMLDANAADHALPIPNQLGPLRTARAFAIVEIAIFDAVNAIAGVYHNFTDVNHVAGPSSIEVAVAQAAHDTLLMLFPSQAAKFDTLLSEELRKMPDTPTKRNGVDLGRRVAAAILAARSNDGSQYPEELYGTEYLPAMEADKWRQDPISIIPLALGSRWGELVAPFVLPSADQFPIPPPPVAGSAEFIAAFDEVKNYGGCGSDPGACSIAAEGSVTDTIRTSEQTQIGIFWGYDGTPGVGTPPRLFNQIALQIAQQKRSSGLELARLLALINVAMADAGLAAWKSKYDYEFCRPITAIREAGLTTWTPLGAPASNKIGPNLTPPFPSYASGHATFGAALFQILRRFYHTDRIPFDFESDEFNGSTKDNTGVVRPRLSRSYANLTQAEEENGQSRIYLGVHWAFDKTAGIAQGREVANYIIDHVFTPQSR